MNNLFKIMIKKFYTHSRFFQVNMGEILLNEDHNNNRDILQSKKDNHKNFQKILFNKKNKGISNKKNNIQLLFQKCKKKNIEEANTMIFNNVNENINNQTTIKSKKNFVGRSLNNKLLSLDIDSKEKDVEKSRSNYYDNQISREKKAIVRFKRSFKPYLKNRLNKTMNSFNNNFIGMFNTHFNSLKQSNNQNFIFANAQTKYNNFENFLIKKTSFQQTYNNKVLINNIKNKDKIHERLTTSKNSPIKLNTEFKSFSFKKANFLKTFEFNESIGSLSNKSPSIKTIVQTNNLYSKIKQFEVMKNRITLEAKKLNQNVKVFQKLSKIKSNTPCYGPSVALKQFGSPFNSKSDEMRSNQLSKLFAKLKLQIIGDPSREIELIKLFLKIFIPSNKFKRIKEEDIKEFIEVIKQMKDIKEIYNTNVIGKSCNKSFQNVDYKSNQTS